MKRFTIICAIVGGAALLLGAVMLGAGYAMGGTHMDNDRSFGRVFTNPASIKKEAPPIEGAQTLTIDFGRASIGTLSVQPGEQFQVEVSEKLRDYVTCTNDDGSYRIRCSYSRKNNRMNWSDQEDYWVTVTLPEGEPYQKTKISLGLGDADIRGIQADTVDFKTGTGEFRLEDISTQRLYFEGGAGVVTAEDLVVTDKLVFEAGVGDYDLRGDMRGDLSITGGVGEFRLLLDGKKEEYQISAQSGLGEVLIDNRLLSNAFSGGLSVVNPDAPNSMKLTCGVGSISVDFNG